ncbi:MAG: hypothetical protein ACM3SR_02750 [Ignavibacteriales bacterium]
MADVVVLGMRAMTFDRDHFQTMSQLVAFTFKEVDRLFHESYSAILGAARSINRQELLKYDHIQYTVPSSAEVASSRQR